MPFSMNQELNNGASIVGDQMIIRASDEVIVMSVFDFTLSGKHNQYNTMAAGIA